MKLGILTFHSAHNYGAVLQCYAFQEYLKNLGHDVYIIDYKNHKLLEVYEPINIRRILRKNLFLMLQKTISELKLIRKRFLRFKSFNSFIDNKLNLAPVETIEKSPYDIIFVGSDQVWNFHLTCGFDPFYWGDFIHPQKTIIATFSASMQDTWDSSLDIIIQSKLENFDHISVRETSLAEKLQKLTTIRHIYKTVDPTLLVSKSNWEKIADRRLIDGKYVLFYQVDKNISAKNIAQEISDRMGYQLIVLSANIEDENDPVSVDLSPSGFISLVKYSEMVVCASFHATVFSLIFKKNFYAVKGKGKNARIYSLLSGLSLEDRIIEETPSYITPINYDKVTLLSIKRESETYINDVIKIHGQNY